MSELVLPYVQSNRIYRIAVSCLFFMQGVCFASWTSRIPTIQEALQLSDAGLGLVLLSLPAGSLVALPFSGWLVSRYGSKRVSANALILYSLLLVLIGFVQSVWSLVAVLVLYGMAGNTSNIAINTQAVGVEARYGRNIMASFHGLWSLAGFMAGGIGSLMIGKQILPGPHFVIMASLIVLLMAVVFKYMLPDEAKPQEKQRIFVKPDRPLLLLGVISFCCMICEGAMFDWSGIYFQKVVGAEAGWIGAGFTAFMCTMATGRFVADRVAHRVGFKKTIQLSGILIAGGLMISVLFPFLLSAIIGFLLVGFGVSSVVPLVYSEAGKSKTMTPGMALAAVSSIGFLGFLIGPPLIGLVAGVSGLQTSFVIIAVMGLTVALIAGRSKA